VGWVGQFVCVERPWCHSGDTDPNSTVLIAAANGHTVSDKPRSRLFFPKGSNKRLIVSRHTSVYTVPINHSCGWTQIRVHVVRPCCDCRDTEPESTVLIAAANVPIVSDRRRSHEMKDGLKRGHETLAGAESGLFSSV